MLETLDTTPILLTLRLALITTALLMLVAIPLAWWLARSHHPLKPVFASLVTLPLILPPTVLGFYLLLIMGPHGWVGMLTEKLGLGTLPFTFPGLVLASMLYSLPFAVQPLHNVFTTIGSGPLEAAATLRASPRDRFFSIALPLARPGLLTAVILSFAHTVGEFGVVLMIGGNIPGSTQVLSVAIYNHVEAQEYAQAHWLAAGMLVVSFLLLLSLQMLEKRKRWQMP